MKRDLCSCGRVRNTDSPTIHPCSLEPLMEGQHQINEAHNHQDSTVQYIMDLTGMAILSYQSSQKTHD